MPFHLIDEARKLLPADLAESLAGSLNEHSTAIQKALSAALPSVIAGLLNQSTGSGKAMVMNIVRNYEAEDPPGTEPGMAGTEPSSVEARSWADGWLQTLFESHVNTLAESIAAYAGIRTASAMNVLRTVAPAVLGAAGKHVRENNLSVLGLSALLQSQKSSIVGAIPAGFNLADSLGLSSLTDLGEPVSSDPVVAESAPQKPPLSDRWLWLIILIVAAILIWLFTRKAMEKDEEGSVINPVATAPHIC